MSVAITCATCGEFFVDFGLYEQHALIGCQPRPGRVRAANMLLGILQPTPDTELAAIAAGLQEQHSQRRWRELVTVRDALFLRQMGIDPL